MTELRWGTTVDADRGQDQPVAGAPRVTGRRMRPCPRCGAVVADIDGPVHAYVPSSPGCWRTFGQVQADESHRFGYPAAHRTVVDSYLAQHPGNGTDRRDRQSVFVHLVGLCAVLEAGVPPAHATKLLGAVVAGRADFPVLRRSSGPGELTLLHVVNPRDLADYERRAREWAQAVWRAWADHHEMIRRALGPALAR